MILGIFNLAPKRNVISMIVFYLAYLVLFTFISGFVGVLQSISPNSIAYLMSGFGGIMAGLAPAIIGVLVLRAKRRSRNLLLIVYVAIAALIGYFNGAIVGLFPVAVLTMLPVSLNSFKSSYK